MRKLFVFIAGLGLSFSTVQAQKISGMITDESGKGQEKTTVSLLRAKDSSVVKLAVSSSDGKFSFQSASGKFLVSVSHVGYMPRYSGVFEVTGDVEVPVIQMTKAATNLQGVSVTAQKPMVEVKADKTILNVEGTINSVGTDALELLRKSPGVTIDKDDNVSLSGKNGVQIYVDG
ncbi:MAG TPA: carboxypeptidase-like regulatory domain-containing protein, partial [Chitinophagaceae bacterium]|nr:carboxypeptidase-like regulatory domain-containing protein [Chitinophagaceae bacterium]